MVVSQRPSDGRHLARAKTPAAPQGSPNLIDDLILARALHVLAVVRWIGAVGFVTLFVLPFAISSPSAVDGLALFDAVERRFAAQVRFSILIAGAAGFWLIYRMDLWTRIPRSALLAYVRRNWTWSLPAKKV